MPLVVTTACVGAMLLALLSRRAIVTVPPLTGENVSKGLHKVAHEEAYTAILAESERTGWPERNRENLTEWDRILLLSDTAPEHFVWTLYPMGTRLFRDLPEEYERFLFSVGGSVRTYIYDKGLREATPQEAIAFLKAHEGATAPRTEMALQLALPSFEHLLRSLPYELRTHPGTQQDWQFHQSLQEFIRNGNLPTSLLPALDALSASLPLQPLAERLQAVYTTEVFTMLGYARECQKPRVQMSLFCRSGRQYVSTFSVSDLALRHIPDQMNLHLQNTSQWKYAGAIVIDTESGCVSSHH